MRLRILTAAVSASFVLGCRSATVPALLPSSAPSVVGLELRFEEQRCFSDSAVGDTVRASVFRRGDLLSPPSDSGSPVLLVVRESALGSLGDSTSRPQLRLDPVSFRVGGVRHPLNLPSPAFEPRVFNPPGSSVLQMCIARGGILVFLR